MPPVSGVAAKRCPASVSQRTTAGRMRGRPPTLWLPLPGGRDRAVSRLLLFLNRLQARQGKRSLVPMQHQVSDRTGRHAELSRAQRCASIGRVGAADSSGGCDPQQRLPGRGRRRTGDDGQRDALGRPVCDAAQALHVLLQLRERLLHQHAVQVHLRESQGRRTAGFPGFAWGSAPSSASACSTGVLCRSTRGRHAQGCRRRPSGRCGRWHTACCNMHCRRLLATAWGIHPQTAAGHLVCQQSRRLAQSAGRRAAARGQHPEADGGAPRRSAAARCCCCGRRPGWPPGAGSGTGPRARPPAGATWLLSASHLHE
jgi:hypothetical protein